MARPALAALAMAAVLATASAPEPCCLRVTPYHIQALAQRMAQRFQALEYRAQDLRYVFASFQQVHGNVSHRLRYLEAEHAHLSEMVSRLDSRLQTLEEEKRMEQYRQRVEYYRRGQRNTLLRTPVDDLLKPPVRSPYVMRRRREDVSALPHLLVHLDQPKESSVDAGLMSPTNEPTQSVYIANDSPSTSGITSPEPQIVHQDGSVSSQLEGAPNNPEPDSTPLPPVFMSKVTEASPQLVHDAPVNDSATTPTPLWQLEETASALLNVMSAGDDDVGDANVPNDAVDDAVSYWAPANESDSLEELFDPKDQGGDSGTPKCTGQSSVNCSGEASGVRPTLSDGVPVVGSPTQATILESLTVHALENSSEVAHSKDAITFVSDVIDVSGNKSDRNESSESSAVNVTDSVVKTTGCKSVNRVPSVGSVPPSTESMGNLSNLLLGVGNATGPLLDIFSPNADVLASGPSPPPDGDTELSDAELQEALRELDALLQRPPTSAQPPDPEKVLLKRALTLALTALERTSDACLKLVNFTADAFEGLAATDA